jgi:TldD protein
MLNKEKIKEILNIALKTGGDFADIFIENTQSNAIVCEDNKIEKILSGTDVGAGIRVISGEQMGYACSNDLSFSSLKKAAEQAGASISGKAKKAAISLKKIEPVVNFEIKKPADKVSLSEKIKVVETANSTARSFGERVKQVIVQYGDVKQDVIIANSEGSYVEDQRVRTRFIIQVIAAKDGVLQTAHEAPGGFCGFELFEKYDPKKTAEIATKRALMMLDAPHAPTGKMTVVLSGEAGGTMIHEACGHSLEADFILKRTSVFAGKMGQKVASDLITVIDDASLPGNYGSFRFDDEGTPAQRTILIENGILKDYMSDKYNARELGLNPSGNGRRENFRHKPVPRMTNTYIAPGKNDPQEIINSVKNGLLVKRMGGGEVNTTNGDFVFEITEGYLIEDGKIKNPVRGAALVGNGPEVLRIIDMVGNDLTFMTGTCGKFDHAPVSDGQPTIRIPEIIVGGR